MLKNKIDTIKQVFRFEKRFSRNQYNGGGNDDFIIKEGTIPIMISAPHSINQFREGKLKWADKMTCGIALFLHKTTGCHLIYSARYSKSDPNYDSNTNNENLYQTKLTGYVKNNKIQVLIDLHGASINREYAIEIGTAPIRDENDNILGNEYRSLHNHAFIANLVTYTFDFFFRELQSSKKETWHNVIFDAGRQNTVTKYVSENSNCSCIQLEINGAFRDTNNTKDFLKLLEGLSCIINTLGNIDWSAKQIEVYRLWQSNIHKPQDKVELSLSNTHSTKLKEYSLLYLSSYFDGSEIVRLYNADKNIICSFKKELEKDNTTITEQTEQEYLFLTNRLIEKLFGRDWIVGQEQQAYLRGAPIVIYEKTKDSYQIGVPKADQIEGVSFSSELYQSKLEDADKFEYIAFNRYTDSRFYVDFSKADYQDYGRVKDVNEKPAMKVMIPRYYKRLLGYLDRPLSVIRYEEFKNLLQNIEEEIDDFITQSYQKKDNSYILSIDTFNSHRLKKMCNKISVDIDIFKTEFTESEYEYLKKQLSIILTAPIISCYEKIFGEVFYKLKEDVLSNEHYKKDLFDATEIQRYYGLFDNIELLRVHKKDPKNIPFNRKIYQFIDWAVIKTMKKIVGNVKLSLKTTWTSETDDKNNVARLSPNMMSLIGVSENDKIIVKFGNKKEVLRVLASPTLTDFQVGVPAPTRKKLGMNSLNDVVTVFRDMKHIFKRHSLAQTIALIGLILTVSQITDNLFVRVLLCIIFIPLILYFVLNEERIKVK